MRFLRRFFHGKPVGGKIYEITIVQRQDEIWEYQENSFGEWIDGELVLAALMCHVQAVSDLTGIDGRVIITKMARMADENTMSFYPAFEGLL